MIASESIKAMARAALRAWGRVDMALGLQYQVIEKYGPRLSGSKSLSAKLPNGCRVNCDLRDEVQRQMWFYGAYEPVEAYLFKQLLSPGKVVIDAGANVGQYSMLAATEVGLLGSVHSFEPVPSNFALLRQHIEINQLANVHLNQRALWCEETKIRLGMPAGVANNAGAYRICANQAQASTIEAEAIHLDAYAEQKKLHRIDLIKMDIEGAEPFVIKGGLRLIERFRPTMLIEINRQALTGAGSSTAALWELISAFEYRIWRIGNSPETSGPAPDFENFVQGNALLYHGDLPESVKSGWSYASVIRWASRYL